MSSTFRHVMPVDEDEDGAETVMDLKKLRQHQRQRLVDRGAAPLLQAVGTSDAFYLKTAGKQSLMPAGNRSEACEEARCCVPASRRPVPPFTQPLLLGSWETVGGS